MKKYKRCTRCKETKELTSEFWHRNKNFNDGFQYECKECKNNYGKQYRKRRPEYFKEYRRTNREYYREYKAKYYRENKTRIDRYEKEYRAKNPEVYRKAGREYGERLREQKNTLTEEEYQDTLEYFEYRCSYCGADEKEIHRDHVVALFNGGGTTKGNIIPTCMTCNNSKHTKDFHEWYPTHRHYSKERYEKITKFLNKWN